jgi:hypothetical protein
MNGAQVAHPPFTRTAGRNEMKNPISLFEICVVQYKGRLAGRSSLARSFIIYMIVQDPTMKRIECTMAEKRRHDENDGRECKFETHPILDFCSGPTSHPFSIKIAQFDYPLSSC